MPPCQKHRHGNGNTMWYRWKRRNIYFLTRRYVDTHMSWKSYSTFDFLLGLKENQLKVHGYLYTLGSCTKSTKTGHENMFNQQRKRDCGPQETRKVRPRPAQEPFSCKRIWHNPHMATTHLDNSRYIFYLGWFILCWNSICLGKKEVEHAELVHIQTPYCPCPPCMTAKVT